MRKIQKKKEKNEEDAPFGNGYKYKFTDLNESKLKKNYNIVFIGESSTGTKTTLIKRLQGFENNNDLYKTK